VVSDEVFFNLNKPSWITSSTFDQNRFFIGVGTEINPYTNVLIGYLNQLQSSAPKDNLNHVLYVSFEFDFSRIKDPE